jgi:hypothetical protein
MSSYIYRLHGQYCAYQIGLTWPIFRVLSGVDGSIFLYQGRQNFNMRFCILPFCNGNEICFVGVILIDKREVSAKSRGRL